MATVAVATHKCSLPMSKESKVLKPEVVEEAEARQCCLVKENDTRCQAFAQKDSDYCFMHDPEKVEERALAVTKGGELSRKNVLDLEPIEIKSYEDAIVVLEETINLLRAGKVHPNFSNSIFLGCRTLLTALEAARGGGRAETVERFLIERKSRK